MDEAEGNGMLDGAAALRPDAVIFASEAMPWVAFPADVPRFETTYRFQDVLAPERAARMVALAEKARAEG